MIVLLSNLVIPYFFFTFDNSIITLCNINIIFNCTFVTFGGSFIFFSHIWWFDYHIRQYQHHIWLYFCHIRWYPIFFSHLIVPLLDWATLISHVTVLLSHSIVLFVFLLTFDSSIITLNRTSITYGRSQPNRTLSNYLIIDEYI